MAGKILRAVYVYSFFYNLMQQKNFTLCAPCSAWYTAAPLHMRVHTSINMRD